MKNIVLKKNIFSVAALICCYCFYSCNPYSKIWKRPPLTHKDSINLSKRCVAVYPNDTASIKPDTVLIKGTFDSSKFLHAIDSLKSIKRKDSIIYSEKYKDTCTSAKLLYTKGYNDGVDAGYADGLNSDVPDTLKIPTPYYIYDNKALKIAQDNLSVEHEARLKAENKAHIRQTIEFWLIGFILSILIADYFIARYFIKQNVKK